MKRTLLVLVALAFLVLSADRKTLATTTSGTIITNLVSVTYTDWLNAPKEVTYAVTATTLVQNPCMQVVKFVSPKTVTPGGTLTFSIYVTTCNATVSAFNLMVTDRLPANTAYSGNYAGIALGFPGTWTPFSSSVNAGSGWAPMPPLNAQGAPYYFRWVLDLISPGRSAMVTYTTRVL